MTDSLCRHCAVADGNAYCWGRNNNGQVGHNAIGNAPQPVAVDTSGVLGGKTVTALEAGMFHTCGVADGKAYCWGYNNNGQFGDNSTTYQSKVPVAVAEREGVLLGLERQRRARNNGAADSKVPVAVALGHSVVTVIAAGFAHSVALGLLLATVRIHPPPCPGNLR